MKLEKKMNEIGETMWSHIEFLFLASILAIIILLLTALFSSSKTSQEQ